LKKSPFQLIKGKFDISDLEIVNFQTYTLWEIIEFIYRKSVPYIANVIAMIRLTAIVAKIAGKNIKKRHDLTKPQGVRGRNSDNTRLRQVLCWEPQIPLEVGLEKTYKWIESELRKKGRIPAEVMAK